MTDLLCSSRNHRIALQTGSQRRGCRAARLLALGLALQALLLLSPPLRQMAASIERTASAANFVDRFEASPDESWSLEPNWQIAGDGSLQYAYTGAEYHDTAVCTDPNALARRPGCVFEAFAQWDTDAKRNAWLELRFFSTHPDSDPDTDNHFFGLRTGLDRSGKPRTQCFDGAEWQTVSKSVFGRGTPADLKLVLHGFFVEVAIDDGEPLVFPLQHDWSYLEPQIAVRVLDSAEFSVEVDEVRIWTPMSYRLLDLEGLALLPEPWERTRMASSYDRHSEWDTLGFQWGANVDGANGGLEFIPQTETAYILAEIENAPAVVWRMWSALPHNSPFRMAIDGVLRWEDTWREFFEFNIDEFPALFHKSTPTSGSRIIALPFNPANLNYGNGYNSYRPIPFKDHAIFPVDKFVEGFPGNFFWQSIGSYWQFMYSEFPDALRDIVASWELEAAAMETADNLLRVSMLGVDPAGERNDGWWNGQPAHVSNDLSIPGGTKTEVANLSGSPDGRAITAIRLRLKDGSNALTDSYERGKALRELVLTIHWDGEEHPSVWVPLGDFFGTALGLHPYKSLPMGMKLNDDGAFEPLSPANSDFYYYAFWYMPFASDALIQIENLGSEARDIEVSIRHTELWRDADAYTRFHARWHRMIQDQTPSPYPWPDAWLLDQTGGTGRYVGTMLHVYKPSAANDPLDFAHIFATAWWGEGDEKFFVDDDFTQPAGPFPSIFGTGTEDYFGYAWGQPDLFQKAHHGQIMNQAGSVGGHNYGHISVYRWHVADNIPFHERIEARLEKYFRDIFVRYAAVPYFYLDTDHTDPYQNPEWVAPDLDDYYPPLDAQPPWATRLWTTFVGADGDGTENEDATNDVLFDAEHGSVVVVGHTSGIDVEPQTAGTFPADQFYGMSGEGRDDQDVYILKLDPDGARLWTSVLLGSGEDSALAVCADEGGNLYVAGDTDSVDFPFTEEPPISPPALSKAFLAKFSPAGELLWAKRLFGLGEPGNENVRDIACDTEQGLVFVVGGKTLPGPKTLFSDAFVVGYDLDGGSRLATDLGGSETDVANGVSASDGTVYIAGTTESPDFPVANGFDSTLDGPRDGFVARLDSSLAIQWATLLGGAGADEARAVEIYRSTASKDVFVVGETTSLDFPGTAQGYASFYLGGLRDAFISRFEGDTGQLLWSSYHGGSDADAGFNVAIDEENDNVYLAGKTGTNTWIDSFLFTPTETDDSNGGLQDAFVARVAPDGSALTWSSLLGGTGLEENKGLAVDDSGNVLLCGWTTSGNFINFVGAWDQIFDGSSDGYLTKMFPAPLGP